MCHAVMLGGLVMSCGIVWREGYATVCVFHVFV